MVKKTSPLHASVRFDVIPRGDLRCSYVRFARFLLEVYILGLYAVSLTSTATHALEPVQDPVDVVPMTIRAAMQPSSSSEVEARS